jgi:hypothetical protein
MGGARPSSARVSPLRGDLILRARHDVRGLEGGTTVHHPVVGELRLHRDKLPVGDVLLVLYYADQGSDSDEKLRLLASIAQAAPTPVEPLTRADRLPGS